MFFFHLNNSDYEEYLQILNQLPVTGDKFCSTSEDLELLLLII